METVVILTAFLSACLLLGAAIGLGVVVWFFGDSGRRSRPTTIDECKNSR